MNSGASSMIRVLLSAPLCLHLRLSSCFTCWPEMWIVPQTSVMKETKRLQSTIETPEGPRKCLKLVIQREKKKPLVAIFGGLPLKRRKNPPIEDRVILPYARITSEIVERLLNDTCEVCGSKENVEMHNVRHLKDLNKKGKREMPLWMKIMISRKRKSIPLCKGCHDDVHSNRPKSKRQGNRRAG